MLEARRRGSIEVGDPVYYRDEEVGKVVSHGLHDDARSVGIEHLSAVLAFDRCSEYLLSAERADLRWLRVSVWDG